MMSCSSPTYLTPRQFIEKAKIMEEMHSAQWVSFRGVKNGKANIEYGTSVSSSNILTNSKSSSITNYWTEYSNLPKDVKVKITNKIYPWVMSKNRN